MNCKQAKKLRKAAGGQEIATERKYYYEKVGSGRQTILDKSCGRKRYHALKRMFLETKK